MIDFRHETFFALCRIRSYTKTADFLHITQPAVSKHIRQLEEGYGGRLFEYRDKTLYLTPKGERLYAFMQTLHADLGRVQAELKDLDVAPPVVFGATLTIGEYMIPQVLDTLLCDNPRLHISMMVENTKALLEKLQDGTIEFALLEGFFDKARYEALLLSREAFIPVCAIDSPLADKTVAFEVVTGERLILRERGSGTREIFEQAIMDHNYSTSSFAQVIEIGNMSAIKKLVARGHGISFMYRQAADDELKANQLAKFQIDGFSAEHEFNMVFLKNSVYEQQYHGWFELIKSAYR